MQLSPIGEIVVQEWGKTQIIRSNVILDEWIIMPNHMHMIVVITHKIESTKTIANDSRIRKMGGEYVGINDWTIQREMYQAYQSARIQFFSWQSRFYDHIIRSENALHKARLYITANPMNWDQDRDNVAGVDM